MSNGTQFDREDEDGAPERDPGVGSAGGRRALLGAGAGSFALVASGLLPGWLADEAAARPEGALDGRLGGRHGRNRRGRNEPRRRRRERRREQDRRQREKDADQDKPRGNVFFTDTIKFNFEVAALSARSVKVEHYIRTEKANERFWKRFGAQGQAPGISHTFFGGERALLWIDDRFWVEAESLHGFGSPAKLKMGYNGTFLGNPPEWRGGTVVFDENMDEGSEGPAVAVDGFTTQVTRLANEGEGTRTVAVFKVVVTAP